MLAAALGATLLAPALCVATGQVADAAAGPVACNSTAAQVYAPPAGRIRLRPGSVLQCHRTTSSSGSADSDAWQIQYVTTDRTGALIAATGVILASKDRRTIQPLVAYSSTTVGLGSHCATSKQVTGGFVDDFEIMEFGSLLDDGVVLAVSDGVGYLTGQVHTYVTGLNNGHAQLDVARAALRVREAGVSAAMPVVLAGYSEGGHSTLWAAQLASSYAPELPIVGASAGAPPSDLKATATNLDGGMYAGFLIDAVGGLSSAYPSLPFRELLNEDGESAYQDVITSCLVMTLASSAFADISDYSKAHLTLDQIYQLRSPDGYSWGQAIDAQAVAIGVGVPGQVPATKSVSQFWSTGARSTMSFHPAVSLRASRDTAPRV